MGSPIPSGADRRSVVEKKYINKIIESGQKVNSLQMAPDRGAISWWPLFSEMAPRHIWSAHTNESLRSGSILRHAICLNQEGCSWRHYTNPSHVSNQINSDLQQVPHTLVWSMIGDPSRKLKILFKGVVAKRAYHLFCFHSHSRNIFFVDIWLLPFPKDRFFSDNLLE